MLALLQQKGARCFYNKFITKSVRTKTETKEIVLTEKKKDEVQHCFCVPSYIDLYQFGEAALTDNFVLKTVKCASVPVIMNLTFVFGCEKMLPEKGTYDRRSTETATFKELGTINFGMSILAKGKYQVSSIRIFEKRGAYIKLFKKNHLREAFHKQFVLKEGEYIIGA